MSNTKVIDQIIKRAKDQNQKDIELLLKDIKTHNKVEEQRRAKKEEMRLRAEEREKRALENRKLNEELQKEKVKQIKERQKTKEVKNITQEYHKLAKSYPIPTGRQMSIWRKMGHSISLFILNHWCRTKLPVSIWASPRGASGRNTTLAQSRQRILLPEAESGMMPKAN